ncbi:MAG: MFS transporter [Christensenellales bacterium]
MNTNIREGKLISYGVGNLGFGIQLQTVSAYLPFYCTAILGLSGKIMGALVFIGILWDAVTDPVMGYISDGTRSKLYGRRHAYMLFATPGLALANFFLWTVFVPGSPFWTATLITLLLLLVKTFSTVYATPYNALGAEMTANYDERTKIQGYKTVFFIIGMLFPSVMGPILFFRPTAQYQVGQLNPAAYTTMALVVSLIILVTGIVCYAGTWSFRRVEEGKIPEKMFSGIYRNMLTPLKNRDFRSIVLSYLFVNVVAALVGAIGMHTFTYTFHMKNTDLALVFGSLFGIAVVSQPLWVALSKRFDKPKTLRLALYCMLTGAGFFALALMFRSEFSGNPVLFFPFALFVGAGTGGALSLPSSMVADTLDEEELQSGRRREGTYYGCMTFCYKLAQGIAIIVVGFMLDLVGFNSELGSQTTATEIWLGLIMLIGCVVSVMMALFALRKYSLSAVRIAQIQEAICRLQKDGQEMSSDL